MATKRVSEDSDISPSKRVAGLKIDDAFTTRCIDNIRVLCADMVEKANSGHPG
jgi:hypothetical protein